jgi:hypothetical protein
MEIKENISSSVSPLQTVQASVPAQPVKRKAGRPKKSEIQAKLKRETRGRPKGDAGRLAELKARLLATSGERMINKVVEIAMSDGHPGQMAAMKMCLDRVLPISMFEKDKDGTGKGITINITGLNAEVEPENKTIDAEDVTYTQNECHD